MPAEHAMDETKRVNLEVVRDAPERARRGRPVILTIRRFIRICHLVEKGSATSRACEAELVTYSHFRFRVSKSSRLQERLKAAEATRFDRRHEEALEAIMAAGSRSWMAHAWFLERSMPELYALKTVNRNINADAATHYGEMTREQLLQALATSQAVEAEAPKGFLLPAVTPTVVDRAES